MTRTQTPLQQAVAAACQREGTLPPATPHKFGVGSRESRTAQGITFDSALEMRHYLQLQLLEQAGRICDLRRQVVYHLHVKEVRVCKYIADFTYLDMTTNKQIVADAKGIKTDMYRMKKKMLKAEYGIEILELTKDDLR